MMKYEIEYALSHCNVCKRVSPSFAKVRIDNAHAVFNLPCGHQYLAHKSLTQYTLTPEQLAILLLASE